jgi:hypothetical protein
MFAGFTQRLNFSLGGSTSSIPSAFPTRPIGQLGNFNTYAQNFIAITGITASEQQAAINQLSNDLVNTGLINKMKVVYPFVGGDATKHQYNLKDPRNENTAFRLNFVGGWTHSSTGALPNGTTGYATTFINLLGNLPSTNIHASAYIRTAGAGAAATSNSSLALGCNIGGSANFFQLITANSFFAGNGSFTQGGVSFTSTTNTQGFWIGSKTDTATRFGFRNGVLNSGVTTTNDTTANANAIVLIGARNNTTTPAFFSNREISFISIGEGLTQAECAILNTIVATFQTILGRNV